MQDRTADPKALGFAAFAIMAWMDSMVSAGWFHPAQAGAMSSVTTFAWLALLIAAFAAFLRGETWHAVFFMFWSAAIWGYRAMLHSGMPGANAFAGWYQIAIAVVSFFLFLSAMRSGLGMATVLVSLGVTLTFVFSGLNGWLGASFWSVISGYIGLLTALAAFWAMAGALPGNGGSKGSATPAGSPTPAGSGTL